MSDDLVVVGIADDVEWYLDKAEQRQTPFTSAVTLFLGLAVAVDEIRAETMPTRIERHRRQARANREAFRTMGLELFAKPTGKSDYSNTLAPVNFPKELSDPKRFFDTLDEYNVSVSSGHTPSGDRMFRVSNMENLSERQVRRGIEAIGKALTDLGFDVNRSEAVRTVERILQC